MIRKTLRILLAANVVGLFAIALWFRATSLEAIPEVCGDELWFGVQLSKMLHGEPFAFRTVSGNPLNPFFSGPMLPLLAIFGPAGWVVRAPAVVSGVLAVALTYVLGARAFDRTTGLIAAVLLAVVPIAIVFSRTAFDCSQIPLISMIAIYFASRRRGIALLLSLLASLIIHPTCFFFFPIPLAIYLTATYLDPEVDRSRWWRLVIHSALLTALGIAVLLAATLPRVFVQDFLRSRDFKTLDWGLFLTGFGRFFLAISLPPHEPPLWLGWVRPAPRASVLQQETLFWVAVLTTLAFGLRRLVLDRRWERLALLAGLAISIVGFHEVARSNVLLHPAYRYGMVLVLPSVLGFAFLLRAVLAEGAADRRFQLAVLSVGAWMLLIGAKTNWFDPRTRGTSESLWTFRSDVKDSHKLALSMIRRDASRAPGARDDAQVLLIAQDYWNYYPFRYYSRGRAGVDVRSFHPLGVEEDRYHPDLAEGLLRGGYAVGYRGGKLDEAVPKLFPADRLKTWAIPSHGANAIVVYRLADSALAEVASGPTPGRR